MNRQSIGSKISLVFQYLLVFTPAFILLWNIVFNWVNIPVGDQWEIAKLFIKLKQGTLGLGDLFSQHVDSRIFFPRLIFLLLGNFTYWDVKTEILFLFFMVCAISLTFNKILSLSNNINSRNRFILLFLINLFLFSPVQGENWLWGFQISYVIPFLCLSLALFISVSNLKFLHKVFLNVFLCTVSTLSCSNGILNCLFSLPLWFSIERQTLLIKPRRIIAGYTVYTMFAIILICCFFYDYNTPPPFLPFYDSPLIYAIKHPESVLVFFVSLLGAPVANGLILARISGTIVFIIFCTFLFFSIKIFLKRKPIRYIYPWLVLGIYSLCSVFLVSIGRSVYGHEQALTSRYTIFPLFFYVSIIMQGYYILFYNDYNKFLFSSKKTTLIACICLLYFLFLHIFNYHNHISEFRYNSNWGSEKRKQYAAAHCFGDLIPDNPNYFMFDQSYDLYGQLINFGVIPQKTCNFENEKNLFDPSINGNAKYGCFEVCIYDNSKQTLSVSGWLVLHNKKSSSVYVILTYTDTQGITKPFSVLKIDVNSLSEFKDQSLLKKEFDFYVSTKNIESDVVRISAFSINTERKNINQIGKSHQIDITNEVNINR